ncbi:hypothetical protein K504DRAFT_396442 [Pleomassaria siparia CBS 279.74]|uniref:Spindle pole body-associated protein cut12 domain-containing protein n=1 Tax=Pleomassaria siparia CBS 279.74 TaxID=1314801 RepID=A0A6G1KQZ4_9PLEO|nr:hypothetical protein K504DRAFT_396442 [Pleomassaria siparia CBS 279.74]
MFSWITGPRITNVIEDLQTDPAYDTTFIEPPETPAHQFAVKAFKHAIFGTPATEEMANPNNKIERKAKLDAAKPKFPAPKDNAPLASPAKQPGGILMTPGTISKGRNKTVSFGSQVVDNEGKESNVEKSGIPNDCPGKFPSPFTPGTELKADVDKDKKKPNSKLTAALLDARSTPQPRSAKKTKAKDDSDITIDVTAPRSESGKYWKEQYENYAEKSEKETKKLIAKQQLAKNFAKKKDAEMTEVSSRLNEERKRFRQRERELEQQNKDYQERLRVALADNTAASVEISALKNRVSILEKSVVASSSQAHSTKASFSIFEDVSKDSTPIHSDRHQVLDVRKREPMDPPPIILGRPVQSTCIPPGDKENSPRKQRRTRRQTLPDASPQPATSQPVVYDITTESAEPLSLRPLQPFARSTLTVRSPEHTTKSPFNSRRPDITKENLPPKSPVPILSSPLPQPSPDPWMSLDNSPLPKMDRLAFPITNGTSYSRPAKSSQPKPTHHRVSKSVSHVNTNVFMESAIHAEKPTHRENKLSVRRAEEDAMEKNMIQDEDAELPAKVFESLIEESGSKNSKTDVAKTRSDRNNHMSAPKDKNNVSSSSADRREPHLLPVDRKEQARRRLAERKQKRIGA